MDPGLFLGQVDNLSNLLHIEELREQLVEHLQSYIPRGRLSTQLYNQGCVGKLIVPLCEVVEKKHLKHTEVDTSHSTGVP